MVVANNLIQPHAKNFCKYHTYFSQFSTASASNDDKTSWPDFNVGVHTYSYCLTLITSIIFLSVFVCLRLLFFFFFRLRLRLRLPFILIDISTSHVMSFLFLFQSTPASFTGRQRRINEDGSKDKVKYKGAYKIGERFRAQIHVNNF